jgi:plastocyanin
VRRAIVAALAVVALAGLGMSSVAAASAKKTITVTLDGVYFNGKANSSTKAKVGDSLKFVWKGGVHNVVSTGTVPGGGKKTNSGAPKAGHAPLTVKLAKKGTYSFECVPHAAVGMKFKAIVS